MYVNVHIHICIHVYIYIYIFMRIPVCVHIFMHLYTDINTRTHPHIYMIAHMYTYMLISPFSAVSESLESGGDLLAVDPNLCRQPKLLRNL